MMRRRLICSAVLGAALGFGLTPQVVLADVWHGVQPNETNLYTDKGGAYCSLIKEDRAQGTAKESTFSVIRGLHAAPAGPTAPASPTVPPATTETPRPDLQIQPLKAPQPFPATSLRIPVLMMNQFSAKPGQSVAYATNLGEIVLADLAVSYVPAGTGPEVVTDSHFGGQLDVSLRTAVAAAAKGGGDDPRVLRGRVPLPTSLLQDGRYIDRPSAGAILAGRVASGLLGEPLRPAVCMSGTVTANQ